MRARLIDLCRHLRAPGYLATVTMLYMTSAVSAQSAELKISKTTIDCVSNNRTAYEVATQHDFIVIHTKLCPQVLSTTGARIGNEYFVPKEPDEEGEAEVILLLSRDLDCLEDISSRTGDVHSEALLNIDFATCTFTNQGN